MISSNQCIKDTKIIMKNGWGKTIGVTLFPILILLLLIPILIFTGPLVIIAYIVLIAPLSTFYHRYYLKYSNEESVSFSNLISESFNKWGRNTLVLILSSLIIFIGFILLYIPGIIFSIALSQIYFIMVDEDFNDLSSVEVIKKSFSIMKGNKEDYFGMLFGITYTRIWVVILTLYIGIIWFLPYVMTISSLYYKQLKAENINTELYNK